MSTYGFDSSGYVAPRAADEAELMRDGVDAALLDAGYAAVDWDSDLVLSILVDVLADRLGSVSEMTQSIHDSMSPNNATGVHLDDIGAIRGVERDPATPSTCTVIITGTTGTIIVTGKLVRGGGEDDTAQWALTEDVTIPLAGTTTTVVQCTEDGPTAAVIGEIDEIVTPVSGWTAVYNAAAATLGTNLESDNAYRLRQASSLANRGSGTLAAVQARVLALDYVQGAFCVSNRTASAAVVSGLTLQPHSIAVCVYPSTLTTAQEEELAELLYRHLDPGIYLNGSTTATVTRSDGYQETVRWYYATSLTVNVIATVVPDTGYVLGDVSDDVDTAITDWFTDNAAGGVAIDDLDLEVAIADDVAGVRRVTVTLNGDAFVQPIATEWPDLGTVTVTT